MRESEYSALSSVALKTVFMANIDADITGPKEEHQIRIISAALQNV
jgi:hypothetical protein